MPSPSEREREQARDILRTNHPTVLAEIVWLEAAITEALATARAEGAEAMRERCAVEARGYCRAGENCMRDGGCRHVPCITARQIEGAIRALDVREGDANGR